MHRTGPATSLLPPHPLSAGHRASSVPPRAHCGTCLAALPRTPALRCSLNNTAPLSSGTSINAHPPPITEEPSSARFSGVHSAPRPQLSDVSARVWSTPVTSSTAKDGVGTGPPGQEQRPSLGDARALLPMQMMTVPPHLRLDFIYFDPVL